jgi:membrane anchored protein
MFRRFVPVIVAVGLIAVMTPTPAGAVTYDKLAYLTFTAPVQIPGATLNAGTYRFHLTNPDTSRNVLQVLSDDGSVVYAMFHTISDSRVAVTEDPFVTFRETPVGVPPAVKSLFYGGEHRGYEFVYPKGGPNMIAEEVVQPPITYTFAPRPRIEEAPAAPAPEVTFAEPAVPTPAAEPVPPPAELPRTATLLPFMTVGGLVSLVAGLGIGLLRRRAG